MKKHGIDISPECVDFVRQLLEKDPEQRLGSKHGAKDLLEHPWFASLDVDKIKAKKIKAPHIPDLEDDLRDTSNFD